MDEKLTCGKPGCQQGLIYPHHHEEAGLKPDFSFIAQGIFLAACAGLILFLHRTPAFETLSITFVSIFLEALPFILVGSLTGGFIEVFVSMERIGALFPGSGVRSIFLAAAMGFVFPVCECAIVPVVRRLLQKGFPLGAAVAFLLGGPIVNPLVGLSTAVAYGFDWFLAVERMLLGYGVAVTVGFLMSVFFSRDQALLEDASGHSAPSCCGHVHHQDFPASFSAKMIMAVRHAADDFLDIGQFLVFGAFFAGLLQTLVARSEFAAVAQSPALSTLSMMALAVSLNLCSEADAFVAASFRATAMPMAAQMAFMVLGPMLDLKLLMMYVRVFRKKAILALSGLTLFVVFVCMILMGRITG